MPSESEIQKQIIDWLRAKGIWNRRIPAGPVKYAGARKKSALKGIPDIFGILPGGGGKAFFIEVKTEAGRLSDGQKSVIDELEREGVVVIVARCLEDVTAAVGPLI